MMDDTRLILECLGSCSIFGGIIIVCAVLFLKHC